MEEGLTSEGVDPSGHPLYDRIFHFPPSHTLDTQILEAVGIIKQQGCDKLAYSYYAAT